ncbi:unnamed protein product [Protopolystoma xenopodis]|uniref:Uncharacterized protein n=1 Tax=Protopolystoma xenopodis TaxID=117903 RepID=A0A448WUH3_9PLAT|nr:unnamed protein product [Protopolystoma xenopodis]
MRLNSGVTVGLPSLPGGLPGAGPSSGPRPSVCGHASGSSPGAGNGEYACIAGLLQAAQTDGSSDTPFLSPSSSCSGFTFSCPANNSAYASAVPSLSSFSSISSDVHTEAENKGKKTPDEAVNRRRHHTTSLSSSASGSALDKTIDMPNYDGAGPFDLALLLSAGLSKSRPIPVEADTTIGRSSPQIEVAHTRSSPGPRRRSKATVLPATSGTSYRTVCPSQSNGSVLRMFPMLMCLRDCSYLPLT